MEKRSFCLFSTLRIISFILLIIAFVQLFNPLNIRLFGSEWLIMYISCFLGTIIGCIGLVKSVSSQTIKRIGKLAFYGNLAMTILFFPPIYIIWGYRLESLL
ncbi:hypothetical protein F8154_00750 [Alkaliphilus pronyensis]|uniref:Uncharacterized protein n=1 Tax=Alkaliphilus pronyensis TaxID=1482732 RepID=A0A6I0FNS4_9FIRM|nr:hypothetical protein [Alkaliphilus pronyensis]KAB3539713.1 hypothetical protein F8154_00750 [Alkaliphilus pronyensis]